jgi:predicted MFS family arabinose efflux permease
LVAPALVLRCGRVATLAAGAFGVALSIALLAVGGNWAMASIAFITMNILSGVAGSVWSLMIQESVDDVWRPMSAAVASLFSGLGSTVMSSVGGVLAAGVGYRATFMTSAALVALGAVTVWVAFRKPEPVSLSRQ